ncbi:MAG: hypothetical protein A2719_02040 [Candidatus Ryanbacteria bacterium RIFCSPHIGHO2_01_FULL_45_22]|uniref:tRNA N6-adenosine threonylcarbamoyltransferase n=1 Tax=Candidatus Ryanbacteria bacterium RIFCSPHIGHO2_01_FULL_45_22 TaxID=1802114 RepID=A0A1G2FY79_9BACT|nr:MAG: hypothetical protein A2719_02040 [Candidatus Ryanbacteria bacterium RIFCSPHIGHO2_01_FULL_45_22]
MNKIMRILAIETSCDETAIAIIDGGDDKKHPQFLVRSSIVSSQVAIHAAWGGVVPNIAKREHQKNLVPVLLQALGEADFLASRNKRQEARKKSGVVLNSILEREPELLEQFKKNIAPLSTPNIDAIAVTQGPGLEPALWVGVNFARALSYIWAKPLVGINHMEGHVAVALLHAKIKNKKPLPPIAYSLELIRYPAIALLVSGGHTELVLVQKPFHYKVVGETRDDAAGEAFDKVAKILGLPYPGGPEISRMAEKGDATTFAFPRPMMSAPNLDFSFSGLKTSVLYSVQKLKETKLLTAKTKRDIAASFQEAVVETLTRKTLKAIQATKAKTFILGGGVAANTELRGRLKKTISETNPTMQIYLPATSLTGDNALMIATAAYAKLLNNKNILTKKSSRILWKIMRPEAHLRIGE